MYQSVKLISIIGAGRSASSLISYLLERTEKYDWQIKVYDQDFDLAKSKILDHAKASAHQIDIKNESARIALIQESDIVVSMLPASMHVDVAKECIRFKIPMVTASYVSDEMRELDKDAK